MLSVEVWLLLYFLRYVFLISKLKVLFHMDPSEGFVAFSSGHCQKTDQNGIFVRVFTMQV